MDFGFNLWSCLLLGQVYLSSIFTLQITWNYGCAKRKRRKKKSKVDLKSQLFNFTSTNFG